MPAFETALALVRQGIKTRAFPSASVAIGKGNEIYSLAVYGDASTYPHRVPADVNTLYDMASLTKLMATTFVALKLVEQRQICLSDTLSDYYDTPPDKSNITILQLMTHTSGIPAHFMLDGMIDCPEQAAQKILDSKLVAVPGTEVVYSCMGYILLGQLLERVAGESLDVLAENTVFKPLRMYRTGFLPHDANIAATEWNEAMGCYLHGIVHDENARALCGVSGNAGVFSTIGDTARFAAMLSMRGRTGRTDHAGKEWFISPEIFEKAVTNHTTGLSESRGLGFKLSDDRIGEFDDQFSSGSYGHTGYTGTSIRVDAKTGIYAVLLTNRVHFGRDNTQIISIRRDFHNSVISEASRIL